jgi:DNA-binding NarL/FixJ family response regulator
MSEHDVRCVLLADRHPGLMEGIRGLLETTFEVVVMVANEVSLIESATQMKVALVVVDVSLTRGEGLGMIRRLRARCPEIKLVAISALDEPSVSRSVLEAGANGFVLKRTMATDLLAAVDAVLAGGLYVSPEASRAFRGPPISTSNDSLS